MSSLRGATVGALTALALLLAGCAGERVAGPPPGDLPDPSTTIHHGDRYGDAPTQPPPFVVRYDDTELILEAVTYCYTVGTTGSCADGVDDNPPSVGSPDELLVFVPVTDFTSLVVGQTGATVDDECPGRSIPADVEDLGDGWWRVHPNGPAAVYTIELFASGTGSGDMIANLMWTTPRDGPMPEAEASLALIADHDGEPDSYGLELFVSNLAETPVSSAATITVTAANGQSSTFDARQADGCQAEGSVFFDGPIAEAKAAAALGDFPFAYRVDLTLDGETHVGTGIYPDDLEEPTEIAVPLEFTPTLP